MADLCNHTSVGVIVTRGVEMLLFQRQKFPIAKAPCAGHVDSYTGTPGKGGPREANVFRTEAVKELWEETGIKVAASDLRHLLTVRADNACRRQTVDGGPHWHLWRVYTVELPHGQKPHGNDSESKDLAWYSPEQVAALQDLEPVWRDMLTTIGFIS